MTANNKKSYFADLKKLVDKYNNSYSVGKKPNDADYSALTADFQTNSISPKFKVGYRITITKYKNIFSKVYTENWSKEMFVIDSMLKTYLWTYKIKDLNGEKITGSFYEKEVLLSKL